MLRGIAWASFHTGLYWKERQRFKERSGFPAAISLKWSVTQVGKGGVILWSAPGPRQGPQAATTSMQQSRGCEKGPI